jgi:hypothetical protein
MPGEMRRFWAGLPLVFSWLTGKDFELRKLQKTTDFQVTSFENTK